MNGQSYRSMMFSLAAVLTAGVALPGLASAQDGVGGTDNSQQMLMPLVMFAFDTSGSMNTAMGEDGNTRFTAAIQQLSGKALTPSTVNISFNSTRFPRLVLECSGNECGYKERFICGNSYGSKTIRNDKTKCYYTLSNSYSVRNLLHGFDGAKVSDFTRDYANNGILHDYINIVKFGFSAMSGATAEKEWTRIPYYMTNDDKNAGIQYGQSKFTFAKFNTNNYGLYNANPAYTAPTIYPTPSDEPDAVRQHNEMIITNLRGYTIRTDSGTPLGGLVAYLAGMFNTDNTIDPGFLKQPKPGTHYSGSKPTKDNIVTDDRFACRKKAAIIMSDGAPNEPGGNSSPSLLNVLNNAKYIYENGVTVYTIAYAQETISPTNKPTGVTGLDTVMNNIAFWGGSCREFGHTGRKLNPLVAEDYKVYTDKYLPNYKKKIAGYTSCYYNAFNGQALKEAVQSILNEVLAGYTSKSKMVTTSAVGKLSVTNASGDSTNGWYNIYSGFKLSIGNMRKTGLQREVFACDNGLFKYVEPDDKKHTGFIDMADMLDQRLSGCRTASLSSDGKGPKGDCSSNRAIFVGDYSAEAEGENVGRYAIRPEIIHFTDSRAGVIRADELENDWNGTENKKYNFFAYEMAEKNSGDLNNTLNSRIDDIKLNDTISKYMISPYECVTPVDCLRMAVTADDIFACDKGKCVKKTGNEKLDSCMPPVKPCKTGYVCLDGQCRKDGESCIKHDDCTNIVLDGKMMKASNQVCHAGKCVTGSLLKGDIRDLLASIPLGTIEYASPVVVPPPSLHYRGADYVAYKKEHGNRDTMMYIPANDGMLHAFILGKNNSGNYDGALFSTPHSPKFNHSDPVQFEGEELWAFIPKETMPNIHKVGNFSGAPLMNLTPTAADVKVPADSKDGKSEWRSVLVGGFREGGRGYFALDVTNPASPIILWEIDHQWQSEGEVSYPKFDPDTVTSAEEEEEYKGKYPFIRMGKSYSEAVITNILINDKVEPVAILAAGKPTITGNPEDVTGKAIYIVRLYPKTKNDLLVKEIRFDSGITGTPSVFPAGFNSIARMIYVGDENGALHRIDISSSNMNEWRINNNATVNKDKVLKVTDADGVVPIFDPNNISALNPDHKKYEMVTYKPAVNALTSSGYPDIQIAVASGDSSVTAIGPQDLNYMALFVDHYNAEKNRYFLNNLTPDSKFASARNLKPLVIVFNPTPSIRSTNGEARTFETKNGKQLFEIVAGEAVKESDMLRNPISSGSGSSQTPITDGECPSCCDASKCGSTCTDANGDVFECTFANFCFECSDEYSSAPTEHIGGSIDGDKKKRASGSGSGSGETVRKIRAQQKVMGAPLTYNFKTYFPTFNAPEESDDVTKCDSGYASIWYADRYMGTQRWKNKDSGLVQNESELGSVKGVDGTTFDQRVFANGGYINLKIGTLVYGLAMTPQLVCMNNAKSSISVSAPMLVAQTGGAPGISGANVTGTNSGKSEGGKSNVAPGVDADIQIMSINEEAIQATATVLSWASVYE